MGAEASMRTAALFLIFTATGCVPRLYGQVLEWDPPDNGWPQAEPPEDLQGEGWEVGEVAPDFRLVDQFGDTVSLWQFYGDVILVDVSTMWCAPCQELARHTEETWLDYRDEGFMYLTVLQEDVHGGPPDVEALNAWAEGFGISAPVLDDGSKEATGKAVRQGQFPVVLVVGRDMRVTTRVNPIEDSEIRRAVEAAL